MIRLATWASALLIASQSFAQTSDNSRVIERSQTRQQQQSTTSSPRSETQGQDMNSYLAGCVATGNQEEIAFSEFGMQRAQHPKVKEFAQKMVQEHNQFLTQLKQHAPASAMMPLQASAGSNQSNNQGSQGQNQRSQNQQGQSQQQSNNQGTPSRGTENGLTTRREDGGVSVRVQTQAGSGSGQLNVSGGSSSVFDQLLMTGREKKQRCLDLTIQNLESESSGHFDKAFMGMQVSMHIGMQAEFETLQKHASGELQQIFAQGAQNTRQHLEHAKEIMKELASSEGEQKSNRQNAN